MRGVFLEVVSTVDSIALPNNGAVFSFIFQLLKGSGGAMRIG